MEKIGVCEAKTQFARLVREASAGKVFVITKRGEPVAQISPIRPAAALSPEAAVERMLARKVSLGIPIRNALASGRRS
ncbi:MAG: type II toxin-antitoxin system Phd/YefM family antitoxin [Vulcanimicrobiaceae bacterium]